MNHHGLVQLNTSEFPTATTYFIWNFGESFNDIKPNYSNQTKKINKELMQKPCMFVDCISFLKISITSSLQRILFMKGNIKTVKLFLY